MTALASLRGYKKSFLFLFAAIFMAVSAISGSAAQAAVTIYPSFDGFMLSPVSSQIPLLYGEVPAGTNSKGAPAVLTLASDLIQSQPAPLQAFQMYPLEMMPAQVLLQNYVASTLPQVRLVEEEDDSPNITVTSIFKMLMPVSQASISSRFGWRHGRPHQGMDFAAPIGTPITSVESGRVIYAGWMNGYGKLIAVDHGNGLVTRYAHCSGIGVKTGQHVNKGALIGRVGNTGRSTGPHLHFEVLAHGVHKNPEQYLNKAQTIVHAH